MVQQPVRFAQGQAFVQAVMMPGQRFGQAVNERHGLFAIQFILDAERGEHAPDIASVRPRRLGLRLGRRGLFFGLLLRGRR